MRRLTAVQYRIPAAVLFLGIVSTVLVLWIYRIGERQKISFLHIDAKTHLQIKTAYFHIRIEEALSDGDRKSAEGTLAILDDAINLSQTLLYGGNSALGVHMPPLDDPGQREQMKTIAALLADFRKLSIERISDPMGAVLGSPIEKRFDAAFVEIEEKTHALEFAAERLHAKNYARTKRLLLWTVLVWTAAVAVATLVLLRLESQRRHAEHALKRAYDDLETRVEARTKELAETNRHLQEEIAERKRVEHFLRKSEEEFSGLVLQLRTLLDTLPDRITLVSRDFRVLWTNWNASGAPDSGRHEPGAKRCYTLWHDLNEPCKECPAAVAFAAGKPEGALVSSADGKLWDIRAVPVPGADGRSESVLEVAMDVTKKLAIESETRRSAHLASVGELAAGVAHEINNPINGIINYAQILWNQSGAGTLQKEVATGILEAGGRVSNIVRALLVFASEHREGKRPAVLSDIIADSLLLMGSQMKREGIHVVVAIPPDLPEIVASASQIQLVVMNILNNARDAMNLKYRGAHENKLLEIRAERAGAGDTRSVRLTVHDRGTGIPAGILDRVMDPFFTTKPRDQGPGLGLSICHAIVSEHGGKLTIESVEGISTKVSVELPANGSDSGENPRHR